MTVGNLPGEPGSRRNGDMGRERLGGLYKWGGMLAGPTLAGLRCAWQLPGERVPSHVSLSSFLAQASRCWLHTSLIPTHPSTQRPQCLLSSHEQPEPGVCLG